jgi:hypothetical protein
VRYLAIDTNERIQVATIRLEINVISGLTSQDRAFNRRMSPSSDVLLSVARDADLKTASSIIQLHGRKWSTELETKCTRDSNTQPVDVLVSAWPSKS